MKFVNGFPKNQEQYNDARTIIRTNAAQFRWRRRPHIVSRRKLIQSRGSVPAGYEHTRQPDKEPPGSRHTLGEELSPAKLVEPYYGHPQPVAVFQRSLDTLTLPPFLPLEHADIMAKSEIWITLQNMNALLLRLFPPEAHGTDQRAAMLMKSTVATEAEFQTHMFCEFQRYGCWNSSAKIWRVAVEWHALAIRTIRENLKDPTKALSDSNIHAVWALALHKLQKVDFASDNDKPRPSQGPLKTLHLLEYVGGPLEPSAVHRAAWLKMLRLRGGLQSLKSSEYAHLMSQFEIVTASRYLYHPRLEFVSTLKLDLPGSLASNRRLDHPLKRMGFGFAVMNRLDSSQRCERVRVGLDGLALYSLSVDDYMTGRSATKSLEMLAQERNFVQHNFMCLFPGEDDVEESTVVNEGLVDVCQSAGMIYSALCVMPLRAAPFAELVRRIRSVVDKQDFRREWDDGSRLMVWILVMVAIAAIGMPDRSWATAILDRCLRHLKIDTWDDLQSLLSEFLWLPMTNEVDGLDLWDEIETSNPLASTSRSGILAKE